jgi:hypothetical protein
VRDHYPQVKQFITVLRDPFETAVSNYFFLKRRGPIGPRSAYWYQQSLENFLKGRKPNILNHFPRKVTADNYRSIIDECFVEVGITEYLCESLQRISNTLGRDFAESDLEIVNASPRTQHLPDHFRSLYEEKNELEFMVYRYALDLFLTEAKPGA